MFYISSFFPRSSGDSASPPVAAHRGTILGRSPGRYINARRIEEACILLDHGEDALEEIAERLGFYDRHHFSKVFKKYRGVSPATYRKAGIYGVGGR